MRGEISRQEEMIKEELLMMHNTYLKLIRVASQAIDQGVAKGKPSGVELEILLSEFEALFNMQLD